MRLFWLVVLAGCGRIGFGVGGGGSGGGGDGGTADSPRADAAMTAAPACGSAIAAQHLAIDPGGGPIGSWVDAITATVTGAGAAVTYIAPDGVGWAVTYNGAAGHLAVDKSDTQIAAATVTDMHVVTFSGALVASIEGGTFAEQWFNMGTLAPTNAPSNAAAIAPITEPLAAGSTEAVWLGVNASGAVVGQMISATNVLSASKQVLPAGAGAQQASVIAANNAFLVTWLASAASPVGVNAQLFDNTLVPTAVSGAFSGSVDFFTPRSAWAATPNVYAITYVANLEVWIQLADNTLTALGPPIELGAGTAPTIASDGTGFWLAWHDTAQASELSAAYVDATGAIAKLSVAGTGGTEVDHAVVDVGGTAVLFYVERNGATPNLPLSAVPMCAL